MSDLDDIRDAFDKSRSESQTPPPREEPPPEEPPEEEETFKNEINIDGVTFEVTPEVAEAVQSLKTKVRNLEKENESRQKTIDTLNDRLSSLNRQARVGNR